MKNPCITIYMGDMLRLFRTGREMNTKKNDKQEHENVNESGETETTCDTEVSVKTDAERIAELEEENGELHDRFLRKSADFDNYRKRMIREKQEAFDYANTNLLTDLITVLDDFDRAIAAGVDESGNAIADLKPVVDGIGMINKQMRGLLEAKYNLNAYGEKGDLFDHDKHEAIATNAGAVADSVCSEVYLKGYMLKDRVIRPAKVMVMTPDGSVDSDSVAEGNSSDSTGDEK